MVNRSMVRKLIAPVLVVAIGLGTLAPQAASAQSFGVYVGPSYPAYGYGRPGYGYDAPAYYRQGYDDDRGDRWEQHERWEQRQRWEREEARRRYWQHERWEHRGDWRRGDDDDR